MHISDFRARVTSTRVAQQSATALVRKNSGDGVAKRNIPVDFTSAISLRELNKNISPRSARGEHGEPQSEMFARVSALLIPSASLASLSFSHRNARACIILERVWVPRGQRVSEHADEITSRILKNQEHS